MKKYDKIYYELLDTLRRWSESVVGEFEIAIETRDVDLEDVARIGEAIMKLRSIVKEHTTSELLELEDNDFFRGGKSYEEYVRK